MQVFEIVHFLRKVEHIEMIKSAYDKTRAEVNFKTGIFDERRKNKTWCLRFMNQVLVRITAGTNNYELLHTRNRFSKRLLDLPGNTNEVLLWRQVKKSGAKALHIFQNSNNNMNSTTVYFENQKDMINISKFAMYYYNNKLRWADSREQESESLRNQRVKVDRESEEY